MDWVVLGVEVIGSGNIEGDRNYTDSKNCKVLLVTISLKERLSN